jgi:hypothetical protein
MLLFSMYSFKFLISISFLTSTSATLFPFDNLLLLLHHTVFNTQIWDQRQREVLERSWKETNRLSLWYRRLCPFDGCWLLRAIYKGLHGLSFEQVPVHIFPPLKFSFCVTEKWVTVRFPVKKIRKGGERRAKITSKVGFGACSRW